ncbi:MAG: hypothetical protein ACRDF6_04895 [bacterium]
MRVLSIVAAFVVAMWAVGAGWASVRAVWAEPSTDSVLRTAFYVVVFLAAFLYLGFWVYAADRMSGKVHRRIALYERILNRRDQADA